MNALDEYEGSAASLDDLPRVARELLAWLGRERLVRFVAPMGAGKTTLIAAICRELGVQDRVSSPTFAIMNEYRATGNNPVYHFDFYRIEDTNDLQELGLGDALCDAAAWRFVEWPAVGEVLMPLGGVEVAIQVQPDGVRLVRALMKRN